MNFKVGQKVTRNGKRPDPSPEFRGFKGHSFPEMGDVVTIKTINHWSFGSLLTFVEHDNSHLMRNGWEPGFASKCFSPIVERKTDISIFTKMLTPQSHKIDA